ncbi:MAG: hypothetical protein OEY20_01980 [Gemmatimonadota bacterium]|nr:hypothetical protein [Gemmatimonadota bacterium]MDH4352168.1 hypothetical protein [Gemmatimonadota bacterium]MDH5196002.1 hypothetical protein [Gemmatimonadota bacterium]
MRHRFLSCLSALHLAIALAGTAFASALPLAAQTGPLPPDLQIRLAVQAAPAALQEGATVQGYDASGAFVMLRPGTNDMICMAPNPTHEDFEVSCHHASLEPFFARGRELSAQGISGQARTRARWDEITAGTLPMPAGVTNAILTGSGFDRVTAEVREPSLRWVLYMPGATGASAGLPERPTIPGAPWIMFPGTPGAHIMISPPGGG